jgi:VanZ family protein
MRIAGRWRVIDAPNCEAMTTNRKRIWGAAFIAAWLSGILFPFASVRRYSASYRQAFDAVFDREIVHVVMHTFLFAVLAAALASWLDGRRGSVVAKVLGIAAAIGCLQEAIQALTSQPYDLPDGVFDVGADVTGAAVGLVVFGLVRLARRRDVVPVLNASRRCCRSGS